MKLILASTSPRRAALMELAKIDCEILPSSYDESTLVEYDIEKKSKLLAYNKAKDILNTRTDAKRDAVVLLITDGADDSGTENGGNRCSC